MLSLRRRRLGGLAQFGMSGRRDNEGGGRHDLALVTLIMALCCCGCAPKPVPKVTVSDAPNAADAARAAPKTTADSPAIGPSPAPPPTWEAPNYILQLAARDQLVFAYTMAHKICRWDTTAGEIRMLPESDFLSMAPDASVAARTKKTDANRIDVIDLETGRLRATRTFDNPVKSVRAMAEHWAWISLSIPSNPSMPPTSIVLPDSESGLWRFDSDQAPSFGLDFQSSNIIVPRGGEWIGYASASQVHVAMLAEPGRRVSVTLAPEWRPPKKREVVEKNDYPRKPSPQFEDWIFPISMAPIGESGEVMLGYGRLGEPRECRLERWTPDLTSDTRGKFVRLATAYGRCSITVLATSDDGVIAVTSEMVTPVALRRAPRYEAEALTSEPATSIVFLAGGTRVVTGHRDGRMRLWDTQTRALLAKVP
jgi:hypothetical protein